MSLQVEAVGLRNEPKFFSSKQEDPFQSKGGGIRNIAMKSKDRQKKAASRRSTWGRKSQIC